MIVKVLKAGVTMARGACAELLTMAAERVRPPEPAHERLMREIREDEEAETMLHPPPPVTLSQAARAMIVEPPPAREDEEERVPLKGSLADRMRNGAR